MSARRKPRVDVERAFIESHTLAEHRGEVALSS
jgi:hypothetical protein